MNRNSSGYKIVRIGSGPSSKCGSYEEVMELRNEGWNCQEVQNGPYWYRSINTNEEDSISICIDTAALENFDMDFDEFTNIIDTIP